MANDITADNAIITADTGLVLADGTQVASITALKYVNLITSEHNQKYGFMSLVGLVSGAMADCVSAVVDMMSLSFDLDTAVGAQLDIIGLWVGRSRVIPNVLLTGFFGFADNAAALTFGERTDPTIGGVFYERNSTFEQTTTLADEDYRTILRARITKNQGDGNLNDMETSLQFIFGVPCKVSDIGNLSLAIIVLAPISQLKQALVSTLDLLPRPAGVRIGSITYSPL